MTTNKGSQNLCSKNKPLMSLGVFDRSIIIALLSLVFMSWFINGYLIT